MIINIINKIVVLIGKINNSISGHLPQAENIGAIKYPIKDRIVRIIISVIKELFLIVDFIFII